MAEQDVGEQPPTRSESDFRGHFGPPSCIVASPPDGGATTSTFCENKNERIQMITLSITYLLSGLLVSLATLPLVYGKIPMNALYGFRVKQTFESNTSWYHLNEVGGMIFTMLGFPLMLSGILGFFLPETMLVTHSTITLVITFLSIGFAVYLFMRYAIRYQQQNKPVEAAA